MPASEGAGAEFEDGGDEATDALLRDDLSVEVEHDDGLLEEHGRVDGGVNPVGRFAVDVAMVAGGAGLAATRSRATCQWVA